MSRKKVSIATINSDLKRLELPALKRLARDIINRRVNKRHIAGYTCLGILLLVVVLPMICCGGAVSADAPNPPAPEGDEAQSGVQTSRMAPFLSDLNRDICLAGDTDAVMDLLQSHPNIKRDMLKSHQRSGEVKPLLNSKSSVNNSAESRFQAAKTTFFKAYDQSSFRREKADKRHILHFAETKNSMLAHAFSVEKGLQRRELNFAQVKLALASIKGGSKIKGYAVLVKTAAALFDAIEEIEEMQAAQRQAAPSAAA